METPPSAEPSHLGREGGQVGDSSLRRTIPPGPGGGQVGDSSLRRTIPPGPGGWPLARCSSAAARRTASGRLAGLQVRRTGTCVLGPGSPTVGWTRAGAPPRGHRSRLPWRGRVCRSDDDDDLPVSRQPVTSRDLDVVAAQMRQLGLITDRLD